MSHRGDIILYSSTIVGVASAPISYVSHASVPSTESAAHKVSNKFLVDLRSFAKYFLAQKPSG